MFYTRKGDDGTTKFFDSRPGERGSKRSLRAEALGACDEINSLLGLIKVKAGEAELTIQSKNWHAENILEFAQQGLFIVQAELAGAEKPFPEDKVRHMEAVVDAMESEMPEIKSFFVSGGTELGALFDFARTVARRTERRVVAALDAGEVTIEPAARQFINRLSSILYAFARYANFRAGVTERSPTYE